MFIAIVGLAASLYAFTEAAKDVKEEIEYKKSNKGDK